MEEREEDVTIYACRTYPNGNVYHGQALDGIPEGNGILKIVSGGRYEGEFKAGQYHSEGVCEFPPISKKGGKVIPGKRYKGTWKNGIMNGQGNLIAKNGDEYRGEFKGNLYHGKGRLVRRNGDIMEGIWQCGHFSKGVMLLASGTRYEGALKMGQYCGVGKLAFTGGMGEVDGKFWYGIIHGDKNGDYYCGEWCRGKYHGRGFVSFAVGDSYEGDFVAGVPFGRGKYIWNDGGQYEGEYASRWPESGYEEACLLNPCCEFGIRHGKGTRIWANGANYEGEWVSGVMQGFGIYTSAGGQEQYEGEFSKNQKHGKGWYTWGCTERRPYSCLIGTEHYGRGEICSFEGNWARNERKGVGTFRCAAGMMQEGNWEGDQLHGYGSTILESNSNDKNSHKDSHCGSLYLISSVYRFHSYSGTWNHGVREGFGTVRYANGDCVSCRFSKFGQPVGVGIYVFGTSLRWLTWEESRVLDPCITTAIQNSISQSATRLIDGKLEEVQDVAQRVLNNNVST